YPKDSYTSTLSEVNIRPTPPLPSEKQAPSSNSCYKVVHGKHPTPGAVALRTCPRARGKCHALFPTDGHPDEAGLYPTQVGGALLAETTCAAGRAGSGPEGGGGNASGHDPRPDPAPLRRQERASCGVRRCRAWPTSESPQSGTTAWQQGPWP